MSSPLSNEEKFVNKIFADLKNNIVITEREIIEQAKTQNLNLDMVGNLIIALGILPPIPEEINEENFIINLYK